MSNSKCKVRQKSSIDDGEIHNCGEVRLRIDRLELCCNYFLYIYIYIMEVWKIGKIEIKI